MISSPFVIVTICGSFAVGAVNLISPFASLSPSLTKSAYLEDLPRPLIPGIAEAAARAEYLPTEVKPTSLREYSRFVPPFLKYGISLQTITLSDCF